MNPGVWQLVVLILCSGKKVRAVFYEVCIGLQSFTSDLQIIGAGRDVVLAARSEEKAAAVLAELGLDTPSGGGAAASAQVFVRGGVDVTDSSTLSVELLRGVSHVVSALGPIFGRTAEGQMG